MSELLGYRQLSEALKQLEPKVAGKVMRTALRSGGKVIRNDMEASAPFLTGNTRRSIKLRAGPRSRTGISVEVSIGDGFFKGLAFYAAFVLFGWKTGKRGSANRKQIPGTFWANKSFKRTAPAAHEAIAEAVKKGLDEEARSVAKV